LPATFGLYANHSAQGDSLWFAQPQFQGALATRDDYRGRDSGVNGEGADSGGRSLFFSPGVSCTISTSVQLYAFAQLPLYRYVNGTQLAVNWAAVGGVTYRF